jgi:beta-exotoxin I transport system permease protein
MSVVLRHALWRRRMGLLWWGLGTIGMVALLAVAYPTVRDNAELDRTFSSLSPGTQAVLGLGGGTALTSPVGYLNSQFFANILPVMLLVFAVGMAAWSVAGDEAAGTLELWLSNPISRPRVALARAAAVLVLLGTLTAVCAAALVAMARPAGLDQGLPPLRLVQASIASAAVAWTFAAVAFAVGAATGSRPLALAVASALAVLGFLVEGLAPTVPVLRPVQAANPWHWLLGTDPLQHGLPLRAWALPLGVGAVLMILGSPRFARRDLR